MGAQLLDRAEAVSVCWEICSAALLVLLAASAFGQGFHAGIKAGVPLTEYFETGSSGGLHGSADYSAATRRYTVGATGEWRPGSFGLELDALYHRMGYVAIVHSIDSATGNYRDSAIDIKGNSWDFPLMAKYRFGRAIRPYIAARRGDTVRRSGARERRTDSRIAGERNELDHSARHHGPLRAQKALLSGSNGRGRCRNHRRAFSTDARVPLHPLDRQYRRSRRTAALRAGPGGVRGRRPVLTMKFPRRWILRQESLAERGFARNRAIIKQCTRFASSSRWDWPLACAAQTRDAAFAKLADRYFDEVVFRYDPVQGTQAGFHQYDAAAAFRVARRDRLRNRRPEEVRGGGRGLRPARALARRRGGSRTGAVADPRTAPRPRIHPHVGEESGRLLVGRERRHLHDHEPHVRAAGRAVEVGDRAREARFRGCCNPARENLKNPPRIYTEVAIEQMPGIIGFFQNDVPAAFTAVTDQALLADFQQANQAVIDALEVVRGVAEERPAAALATAISASAPTTTARNCCTTRWWTSRSTGCSRSATPTCTRNQAEFKRVAAKIDPKRTPEQILKDLEKDHPPAGKLLHVLPRRARRAARASSRRIRS